MKEIPINLLDPVAIIHHMQPLDVASLREQRQLEIAAMARYTEARVEIYKAWSKNPEKTREDLYLKAQRTGKAIVKGLDLDLKYEYKSWKDSLKLTPVKSTELTKRAWWERLMIYLKNCCGVAKW